MTLALLSDGSCSIRDRCLVDATGVAPDCPQLEKCGSCVMWSAREHAGTGRNLGVCLLDNEARKTLDCNAHACPYYRPRRDSPAHSLPRPARRTASTPRAGRSRARAGRTTAHSCNPVDARARWRA